jgi:hypothetical protein
LQQLAQTRVKQRAYLQPELVYLLKALKEQLEMQKLEL